MHFGVITLFPELVESVASCGVVGRAIDSGIASLRCINPRDFATDAHRTVDDRPYGGGPGMVMKVEPVKAAIAAARSDAGGTGPVIYLSPAGRRFDQREAIRLAGLQSVTLLAGRYEGIDERVIQDAVDEELSLGDFVLSGGEIAAMAVIDAVVRLLPGALGDAESAEQDSFMAGLLDHPHYSRPEEVDAKRVPDVLLSGDHKRIARWREKQALGRTFERRPDLLEKLELTDEQRQLLEEFKTDSQPTGRGTLPGVSLQVENDEQTD